MAKKYYAVKKGRMPGIYTNWAECSAQVSGFSGAEYKSFSSEEQAEQFLSNTTSVVSDDDYIIDSISVDAACSGNPGIMEYRGVDTKTGRVLFTSATYAVGTNNIGEFLAIVDGLKYLTERGSDMPIYSDSVSGIAWVRNKRVKTSLPRNKDTENLFKAIDSAIDWLYDHTYNNPILKWDTVQWGESKADFGRK